VIEKQFIRRCEYFLLALGYELPLKVWLLRYMGIVLLTGLPALSQSECIFFAEFAVTLARSLRQNMAVLFAYSTLL
jgi:hypothetical protein